MRILLLALFVGLATAQSSGTLRLARGTLTSSTYVSGRLEIFLSGQWGTVCDDAWDSTNSDVACRQLGFPSAVRPTSFGTSSRVGFGSGTGRIWLDDVNCVGTESRLISCSNRGVGSHNCVHSEDVAVYCSPRIVVNSGQLRLARGSLTSTSFTSGRLEIFLSGQWGTVCDDIWDSTNSDVACRQLGYPGAVRPTSFGTSSRVGFGSGTGRIWLDDVNCIGTESRLISCPNRGIGSHNCVHSEDVAVYCSPRCTATQFQCTNGQCVSSSFRCNGLSGGCSDGSDEMNCTSCSSGAFLCNNRQCIRTSDRCDGTRDCTDGSDELNCASCISGAFLCNNRQCIPTSGRCNGTRDCTDGSDELNCVPSGTLRLARRSLTSTTFTSGRLEIFLRGVWGTVCDDIWDSTNSDVACRQLGFFGAVRPTSFGTSSRVGFGSGTGQIWLDDVNCAGTESRLISCPNRGVGSHNCVHSEDVAVYCSPRCTSTQFRCANGQCVSSSFRCNGVSGGCSDGSDEMNCTSCSSGAFLCNNRQCIRTSDRCDGTRECTDGSDELNCASCSSGAFLCNNRQCIPTSGRCNGTRDCTDGSDELNCVPSGTLRLARRSLTSTTFTSGRLEIFLRGVWGTVCDDIWDSTNSDVACRQLGFFGGVRPTSFGTSNRVGFGSGTGQIWLDDVNCAGTESRLISCPNRGVGSHNCFHSEDVAVYCSPRCTSTQFRCANGQCVSSSFRCNGFSGGCSDGSDEMNCTSCSSGAFLCNNRQCIRTSDRCDGTRECTDGSDELNCASCSSGAFLCNNRQCIPTSGRCNGTRDCTDGSDELNCVSSGTLRLARGSLTSTTFTSGRLEIFLRGVWGTVCDDIWDSTNSDVACRQLGYFGGVRPTSFGTSNRVGFGSGTGQIWLDDVNCAGTESRLISCPNRGVGSHNCVHSEDVAVYCSPRCTSTQFRCANGQCVSSSFRCNGVSGGCSDGSDEMNCTSCSSGAFLCNNRQCIRTSDRCDGTRECTDGSDELNCASCSSGAFLCNNRQCIPTSGRCNGTRDCTDGSDELNCVPSGTLRLARRSLTSTTFTSGRLEIFLRGVWGTVCDDIWDSTNSDVACRQLGFFGGVRPTSFGTSNRVGFGSGTGQIWLDDVNCAGTESRLISCPNRGVGSHNCFHSEDVAVYCSPRCTSTQFRCANGQCVSSSFRCNGVSGGCSDGSDEMNCTSCSSGAFLCNNRQCIRTSDRCDGTRECTDGSDELNCASCSSGAFLCNNRQCIRTSGRCNGTRECTDGSDELNCISSGTLRLARGSLTSTTFTSGRLEIFLRGVWGTVCDDIWDSTNSDVACRQLGFFGGVRPTSFGTSNRVGFGSGTGQIWLDDVNCAGTESRLISCPNRGVGSHNCVHSEDVAVYCSPRCTSTQFRCTNGQCVSSSFRCNGQSGGCSDGSDNMNCTSCSRGAFLCNNRQCIPTSGRCDGTRDCTDGSDELNCDCSSTLGQFRCASGQCVASSFRCNGRLECRDGSDEMNCSCSSAQFQCANGQCVSSSFRCNGLRECTDGSDETNCSCSSTQFRCTSGQCVSSSFRCTGRRECSDGSDEINCLATSGDLRLARGSLTSTSFTSGRLEIFLNGQWGTVCDDAWDSTNSDVVCRQLGFLGAVRATSFGTSNRVGFGLGSGTVWLDNVRCTGRETTLTSCSNSGVGGGNCDHSDDVAVYCTNDPGTGTTAAAASNIGTIAGGGAGAALIFLVIIPIVICVVVYCRITKHRRSHMIATTPPNPNSATVIPGVQQPAYPAGAAKMQDFPESKEEFMEMSAYTLPPQAEYPGYPPQAEYPGYPPQAEYPGYPPQAGYPTYPRDATLPPDYPPNPPQDAIYEQ